MKRRTVAVLLALGALLPALASAQEPVGLRGSLLGCWRMYRQFNEPAAGSMYWVPSVARLDSASTETSRGARAPIGSGELVRLDWAGTELNPERRVLSGWRVDSDSAYLRFSSGFAGTEFVLALGDARRDTLEGRARGWGDDNNSRTDYGSATAVRVRCPDPTANPNGWTWEQLELAAQRSADSTCSTWRAAREQPGGYRGQVRVDSVSGAQCFMPSRRVPWQIDGRWWCPGAVGADSALRASIGKFNRSEVRWDRRGIDEAQCPGWHSAVQLQWTVPPG